jgi:hypothetical protein
MGAWSHEPFGNDDANDWAYGLEEAEDLSYVEEALNAVLESMAMWKPRSSKAGLSGILGIARRTLPGSFELQRAT